MNDPMRPGFLGSVRLAQQVSANPPSVGKHWWAHHIANTRGYLEAAMQGDMQKALVALGELWNAVLDWQRITGSRVAGVLMAEHTALAKLLIDCFAQNQGGACTDTAAAALGRNVEEHRMLFPKDPVGFANLFGKHVEITGNYISNYAGGDQAAFETYYAQALANGQELGAFVDRIFFGRK